MDTREWTCPACGTVHDRDHNAAKHVKTATGLAVAAADEKPRILGLEPEEHSRVPPPRGPRSLRHRHPRRLPVLGGGPARPRRARHARLPRGAPGLAPPGGPARSATGTPARPVPNLMACQMMCRTSCSASTTCCCPSGTSVPRWSSTGGPALRWRSGSMRPGSRC
ncbi:zinc ribbon domain-containing protein [Streptomyces mirabilis]